MTYALSFILGNLSVEYRLIKPSITHEIFLTNSTITHKIVETNPSFHVT